MKKKASLITFLAILLIPFALFPVVQVKASSDFNELNSNISNTYNLDIQPTNLLPPTNDTNDSLDLNPQPMAISEVVIFFGGLAIGWVIDGVISYKTGKAPSEWIAWGLAETERKVRNASQNRILVVVSFDGTIMGCSSYPCPIQSSVQV